MTTTRTLLGPEAYIPLPPPPTADYLQLYLCRMKSLEHFSDLLACLNYWRPLVEDAEYIASKMTEVDFQAFLAGLREETSGNPAGEEWTKRYNALIFPDVLWKVDQLAMTFSTTWGVAYNRMEYLKLLGTTKDGYVAYMGWEE